MAWVLRLNEYTKAIAIKMEDILELDSIDLTPIEIEYIESNYMAFTGAWAVAEILVSRRLTTKQ